MGAEKEALGSAEGLWCPSSGSLVLLRGSAYSYRNYCFVSAASDHGHTNILMSNCSGFGFLCSLNAESTFPFISVLFAEGFRDAEIHCKGSD